MARPPGRGARLEPGSDLLSGGDLLDDRKVDIGLVGAERQAVQLQEEHGRQEGGALVAVGQPMVAGQVFDQGGALIDQARIGLLVAETAAGDGERGVGKADPRQSPDLLGSRPEEFAGDLGVVAQ